jgi:CRP/FNR family transcriptional regulator, cyclic AMP receptor protein
MQALEKALAQHPFLAGLDRRFLGPLAAHAAPKRFEAQQMIFHEGHPAKEWYLIGQGKVGIETALLGCEGIRIETLGPGEVLGWSWILPPYELHYSARALEPTEVIALDGKGLVALFEKDHDLGYEMMKRFAQVIVHRLAATRARSMEFSDPTPAEESPGPLAVLRPPPEETPDSAETPGGMRRPIRRTKSEIRQGGESAH